MKSVFFLFLCSLLCSCWSTFPNHYVKSRLVGHFEHGARNGIGAKVNIDGYYTVVNDSDMSSFAPFVLYEDGTFGRILFKNVDSVYSQRTPHVDLTHEMMLSKDGFYTGGYYALKGDTIVVNYVLSYQLMSILVETQYRIIDRNHILMISEDWIDYRGEENGYVTRNVPYQFVPANSLPSSNRCGIKFYKWIWKDKEEWRMYKDGVKK